MGASLMLRVPETITAPSTLLIAFEAPTFAVNLETVTAVELRVLRRDGTADIWECDIVSATPREMLVEYAFTGGDEISGTGMYRLSPILTVPGGNVPAESLSLFVGPCLPQLEATSWIVGAVNVPSLGPSRGEWVALSEAESPYAAIAVAPWLALDLSDGDISVSLWSGTDGDSVVLTDYLNEAGSGGDLILTAIGGQLLPVGDGTYAEEVTYDTPGFSLCLKLMGDQWLPWAGGSGATSSETSLDTTNSSLAQTANEIDTTDATPTTLGDTFPLPTDSLITVDVQVACFRGDATGGRIFNERRHFLNTADVIVATDQEAVTGPADIAAAGGTAPESSVAITYTGTTGRVDGTGVDGEPMRWRLDRQSVRVTAIDASPAGLNLISIDPATGPTETATAVTAIGTGFVTGCTFTVGGVAATGVNFISSTEVEFTTPATLVDGEYDVVITNPDDETDTLVDGWASSDAVVPTVSAILQNLGPIEGGGSHTITGTEFTGATGVTIGGVACTSVVVVNSTTITCVGPAHVAATGQSVLVTTPAGTNVANSLFEFWSPAELVLGGFWDKEIAPYVLGSWPGIASAGGSSGRNLVNSGGFRPTVASGEPDFDGTDDHLTNATAMSNYITASAGGVIVIFDADTADAPTASYTDPQLFGDQATYMGMYYNTSGVGFYLLDAGRTEVQKTAAVGVRHVAMARWDGVNIGLTVGAALEVTAPCGPMLSVSGTVIVGQSYDFTAQYDGRIRTIIVMPSKPSDATYTKVLKWARACRGVL